MSVYPEEVMQAITERRNKNISKRMEILKRQGVIDTTDPLIVAKHLKGKKTKVIEAEKVIDRKEIAEKVISENMVKVDVEPIKIDKVAMYIPFARIDKEKRLVSGIATSEALDSYGDIVRITAIEKALPDYLEFGNIREMHGPSAVGTVKEHDLNKKEKYLYITVKVVDDSAWNKVTEAVYKGFSIGGRIIEAVPLKVKVPKSVVDNDYMDEKVLKDYANGDKTCADDEETIEVFTGGYEILELELIEISLVDRPACPEALIDSFKTANKQFIPDRVMILKEIINQTKDLTRSEKSTNLTESLQNSHNSTNKLNFLAQKFAMNETVYQKVLAAVLDYFKSEGIDLSDEAVEKAGSVRLNRSELRDVVSQAVEKTLEVSKGEDGEVEETTESVEAPANPEGTEETAEGKEPETVAEGEPEGEDQPQEKTETEPAPTDGENTEGEQPEEKESKVEEKEEKSEATEPAPEAELEKAIKTVLSPLIESVTALKDDVAKIKKIASPESTQKGVSSEELGNHNGTIFKGLFN